MDLIRRPRRLRKSDGIRRLVRETRLSADALVYPLFVREGTGIRESIASMPGQSRFSPDTVTEEIARSMQAGVRSFLLFGIPDKKDAEGSGAWLEDGVVQQALRAIKKDCPEAVLITDVCMCEYTDHGHCGILEGECVDNDATLPLLAKTALSHARAGADIVAPADMMDGRVAAIRASLDNGGYSDIPIMSYAVKYASAFYGPFRDAADSAPSKGDRRGYQMDCHNAREGLLEAQLDMDEGADFCIVKPALSYLDIIYRVSEKVSCPVVAYNVSGEYSMVKAAAAAGMIDEYSIMCESAVSCFRAGADILITYYAKEIAEAIRKGDIG